jgi:hypothetical protein
MIKHSTHKIVFEAKVKQRVMHNRSICSVNYITTKDSAEYISVSILTISFKNRFSLVA